MFRAALVEDGVERELASFSLEAPSRRRRGSWMEAGLYDHLPLHGTRPRDPLTRSAPTRSDDWALWAEPRVEELAPRPSWSWLAAGGLLLAGALWVSVGQPGEASRWWSRPLSWIAVAAVSLATLGIGELALRRFPSLLPPAVYSRPPEGGFELFAERRGGQLYDRELAFRLAPGRKWRVPFEGDAVVRGKSAGGYRRPEAAFISILADGDGFGNANEAAAGEIAVVGDSFVQGILGAREESWPAVLAARTGTTVRNLGVSGFGPQQNRAALVRFALPRQPRVVLFLIYEGNDLMDAGQFQEFVDSRMSWLEFLAKRERAVTNSLVVRRADRSLVWALMRAGATDLYHRAGLEADSVRWIDNGLNPVCGAIAGEAVCAAFTDYELLGETRSRSDWSSHPGWPLLLAAVDEAAAASRDAGARFVALLAPSKASVYLRLFAGSYDYRSFDHYGGDYSETPPPAGATWHDLFARNEGSLNSLLDEELARRGIDCINLRPALAARAAEGQQLYFPFDTHWNVSGNLCSG